MYPAAHRAWHEVFLNHDAAAASPDVASSVAAGHSFLVIDLLSTASECRVLAAEAAKFAERERVERGIDGLVRKQVVDMLGEAGVQLCDDLLLRQLAILLADVAPLTPDLFGDALSTSPSTCLRNPRLAWSEGEPAINVYNPGGCFTPHEDEQSLTCLVNLSAQDAYTGGGTAFWSTAAAGEARCLVDVNPPTHLLAPPMGTALVFGGTVTHAAQPIITGERIVYVASFSPTSRIGPKKTLALRAGLAGLRAAAAAKREKTTAGPVHAKVSPTKAEECSLDELCSALTGLPGPAVVPSVTPTPAGMESTVARCGLVDTVDID